VKAVLQQVRCAPCGLVSIYEYLTLSDRKVRKWLK